MEQRKESIQAQILEIISKFGFWMITKNGLQGAAGYINIPNRKIYIEVLFPKDFPKTSIILNLPRDLRQNPLFFELIPQITQETQDSRIQVTQVLELIRMKLGSLQPQEIKERLLDQLDEELNFVKSIYNVKTVEGKKYHIRIFYQLEDLNFEIEINYKTYPQKPEIVYHHQLEKMIGLPQSLSILQQWNMNNPPHIVQIVQEIEHKFTAARGVEDIDKLITIKNLTVVNEKNQMLTQNLSFSALKGDIIGIFCFNKEIPFALAQVLLGKILQFTGEIRIFGKSPGKEESQEPNSFIDFHLPPKIAQMLNDSSVEEILNKYSTGLSKKVAKERINVLLSIIGLSNRRNFKLKDLSEGEKRRVIVAFSVIKPPPLLFLFEPEQGLNTTEKKRIWDTIIAINDAFAITTFVYSSKGELDRCHNILVLSPNGKQLGFGTLPQLIGELPLFKEVIVIQFNSPNPAHVDRLGELPGITFLIEERQGEKFRIFTQNDPKELIPLIFQEMGSNIYNLCREPPSLIDFVPFKWNQQKSS